MPADDGDGTASVTLGSSDQAVADKLSARTASYPGIDLKTGVDLGAGAGAGLISGEDLGGASDINDAVETAKSL